jgi:NAD(P)-dependent dehydrogenase (short-subunit alcohol dehydrogenase family)
MNPVYDFKDKVALVTGASSGIGLATAKAFAEAGAAVVLVDINESELRAATEGLTSAGYQAISVTSNVADEAQVAAMVERTVATFGKLDMAFNNAGILGPVGDLIDETSSAFDDVIAVNLRGVWTCMKHELLQMRPRRDRYTHGRRNGTRRHQGDHARSANCPAGPFRRDRRVGSLALQSRRELRARRGLAG